MKKRCLMRKPNITALSSSFMLTSMVGFIVSAFFVYGISKPWGFTFGLFFGIMFISSMISMTYAPADFDHRKKKKN